MLLLFIYVLYTFDNPVFFRQSILSWPRICWWSGLKDHVRLDFWNLIVIIYIPLLKQQIDLWCDLFIWSMQIILTTIGLVFFYFLSQVIISPITRRKSSKPQKSQTFPFLVRPLCALDSSSQFVMNIWELES